MQEVEVGADLIYTPDDSAECIQVSQLLSVYTFQLMSVYIEVNPVID